MSFHVLLVGSYFQGLYREEREPTRMMGLVVELMSIAVSIPLQTPYIKPSSHLIRNPCSSSIYIYTQFRARRADQQQEVSGLFAIRNSLLRAACLFAARESRSICFQGRIDILAPNSDPLAMNS